MTPRHTLQERLSTRRPLIGLLQSHPNFAMAEMAGLCGYDFLLLDGEHGVFSDSDYLHTLQTLAATKTLALMRFAQHDPQALGRYLDMGVDGIVVPNVSTAEQAKILARAMEYPPNGTRGMGAALHRATRYGMDWAAHLKAPRAGNALIVIIESALGVTNVEEILDVDGVDGVIVGPSDLSANLGQAGNFLNPIYIEAMMRIERAAAERGKIIGTAPHPGSTLGDLVARGHRLLIVGADMSLIREAMSAQVAEAKRSFVIEPKDTEVTIE
jgi:4-hydroxy-2-oxoheptanedioate aldolase